MLSPLRFTTAAVALATTLASSAALADTNEWGRVLSDLEVITRRGADVLDSPRCTPAGCQTDTNATAAAPERGFKPIVQDSTNDHLVTFKPTVSLVARDWGSSFRVAGERLALVDALRLTNSTRMVFTRFRLTDARISPFAQVGLGQWRTDPSLLPLTPGYMELAAQAAGGIELRLMGSWQIALESTMTTIYRERSDKSMPTPHVWSTTFASRVDF